MYTIKEVKQTGDTLLTTVEYVFKDGSVETITIPHVMPPSKEEVIRGIENREVSEQRKRDAIKTNEVIIIDLDSFVGMEIKTDVNTSVPGETVPISISKLKLRRTLRDMGMEGLLDSFLASDPQIASDWNDAMILSINDPILVNSIPLFSSVAGIPEDQIMNILITCKDA
jgi:hypothetical protein